MTAVLDCRRQCPDLLGGPLRRLLGVFAHPDDEVFCAGGTFARYAEQGTEIMVVSATRGQAGEIRDAEVGCRGTIAEVREAELRLACERLGVAHVRCLDHIDGALADADFDGLVAEIVQVIRQFRPEAVVSFGPDGAYGHPDHVMISAATTAAFRRTGDERLYPERLAGLSSHQPARLYYSCFPSGNVLLMDRLVDWLTSQPARFAGTPAFVHALLRVAEAAGTMRYTRDHTQVRWYPKGFYVVEQGETPRQLFLVLSGQADVWEERADGGWERLRQLGPGEFFGHAVVDNRPRGAHVVAVESLTCLVFSPAMPPKFAGRGEGARLTVPTQLNDAVDASCNDGSGPTAVEVDVSRQIKAKTAALCAYRSQFALGRRCSRKRCCRRSSAASTSCGRCRRARAKPSCGRSLIAVRPWSPHATRGPTVAETQNTSTDSTREPSDMSRALARFLRSYPAFAKTGVLDVLRATDYARLDEEGHTYLDYTGGGLYAESQVRQHQELLIGAVFGNPDAQNKASSAMSQRIEAAKAHVLEFFHAAPEEYEVIFTPNATGALRLVGESYPFGRDGQCLLTSDNHDSVIGIGEFARAKGASVSYVAIGSPELRVRGDALAQHFSGSVAERVLPVRGRKQTNGKARGTWRQPVRLSSTVQLLGCAACPGVDPLAQEAGWDVLLDAAAFVPANRLDLSAWHPDYVALSFYKLFGYPTGIGALLVRRPALAKLRCPWYGGGTLTFSPSHAAGATGDGYCRTPGGAGFEGGTIDYLGIPAVDIGLRYIDSIGMDTIHTRVMCLTGWLLEALAALRHSNGAPAVRIYGPHDTRARGGTIAMNFTNSSGELIDSCLVERCASDAGISLRSGCHCNPGARAIALGLSREEMVEVPGYKDQMGYEQFLQFAGGRSTGAVRASIGLVSTFADVYRFWEFARSFRDAERNRLD